MSTESVDKRRVSVPGSAAGIDVLERRANEPGPTVLVIGGVHGDEWLGPHAVGRLWTSIDTLHRGRLICVPVAHEAAFTSQTRRSPIDGADLARTFPGSAGGTPTERLATVLEGLLDGVDLFIDVHCAGIDYDMPLFVGHLDDGQPPAQRGETVARAMALPFTWAHPTYSAGRSTSAANSRGIPAVYVEGPGGNQLVESAVVTTCEALRRALAAMTLVPMPPLSSGGTSIDVRSPGNLDRDVGRAEADGWFVPDVKPGQRVLAGDLVGRLLDTSGALVSPVPSPMDARVMFLRRSSRVVAGETLFALGGLVAS